MRIRSELVDRHLKLYKADWDFIMAECGPHSGIGLTPGEVVRKIVHQKVKWLRAKMIERLDELGPGEEEKNAQIVGLLGEDEGEARTDKSADDLGF